MKAVVLAGGKGTRMGKLTESLPKAMIELGGKPILEKILLGLISEGFKEIIIVVNYKKEKIINYFGDGSNFGVKIEYVVQDKPVGTADALRYVEPLIKENYFLLLYGDQLFDFKILSKIKNKKIPLICVKRVENPEKFGVVVIKNKKIRNILEKPINPPSDLINTGIYLLPKDIFNAIKETEKSERGEYELTDSIKNLINNGIDFNYFEINQWIDIGNKSSLEKAKKNYKGFCNK